jgi:anti-sigma regulatory factor (Ser/Thr protein kinase)
MVKARPDGDDGGGTAGGSDHPPRGPTDGGSTRLHMAGDAGRTGEVRSALRELAAAATPEVRDVAVLLTDELLSNAVVHGGGRFAVTAEVVAGTLRVAVADDSPVRPRVLDVAPENEHGRGMAIVSALAAAWGCDTDGRGKVVWFSLDLGR